MNVTVCKIHQYAITDGNSKCPVCGAETVPTDCPVEDWYGLTDDLKRKYLQKALGDSINLSVQSSQEQSSQTQSPQEIGSGIISLATKYFRSAISIMFVANIFIWTIAGIALSSLGDLPESTKCIIVVFGLVMGLVSSVLIYGFLATIIHLSDTADKILETLHTKSE